MSPLTSGTPLGWDKILLSWQALGVVTVLYCAYTVSIHFARLIH